MYQMSLYNTLKNICSAAVLCISYNMQLYVALVLMWFLFAGREFVRQYYTLLNQAPLHLHRYFEKLIKLASKLFLFNLIT